MDLEPHPKSGRPDPRRVPWSWSVPEPPRRVLAAVDVAASALDMPLRVVRTAAALAAGSHAELYVVHAWTLFGDSILSCPIRGVGRARLALLRKRACAERRRRLEALLPAEVAARCADVIVEAGRPGRVVRRVARRVRADVLVMGTLAPPPWPGVVLGEMSEALAGGSDYSILLVRGAAAPQGKGSGRPRSPVEARPG